MASESGDGAKRVKEAVAHIAQATGVDQASVEKILNHLGLETALSRNPNTPASGLRIAAGQVVR
ncbi:MULTISPECIES: hypothetical protein [unclassified Phenylobacterium]|uniref:hypothetical protein n=1 Tax=unclassified Phenylobacterium TaxID=2640670 RepID=UPI00083A33F2|nr:MULTISPECIES: hypothetical protein [unclassified Phenylobacterium]